MILTLDGNSRLCATFSELPSITSTMKCPVCLGRLYIQGWKDRFGEDIVIKLEKMVFVIALLYVVNVGKISKSDFVIQFLCSGRILCEALSKPGSEPDHNARIQN